MLCEYWEYITEVYDTFVVLSNGVNGRMPKEGLYKLFDETRLFKERELELMTNKVSLRLLLYLYWCNGGVFFHVEWCIRNTALLFFYHILSQPQHSI